MDAKYANRTPPRHDSSPMTDFDLYIVIVLILIAFALTGILSSWDDSSRPEAVSFVRGSRRLLPAGSS